MRCSPRRVAGPDDLIMTLFPLAFVDLEGDECTLDDGLEFGQNSGVVGRECESSMMLRQLSQVSQ